MQDVNVGIVQCFSLDDLAQDNVWRFREAIYPEVGAVPVSEETYVLFGALSRLNGGGLLTYQSSPGLAEDHRPGGPVETRAYVHGYATVDVAAKIAAACEGVLECHVTPVRDLVTRPGAYTDTTRTVDGHEWAGATFQAPQRQLHDRNLDAVQPAAYADIETAMAVTVIDPVWGREWFLWDTLVAALSSPA